MSNAVVHSRVRCTEVRSSVYSDACLYYDKQYYFIIFSLFIIISSSFVSNIEIQICVYFYVPIRFFQREPQIFHIIVRIEYPITVV